MTGLGHGLGAALLVAAVASGACGSPSQTVRSEVPQHLILITIDTLRADRVGAYGYARARTPRIDALATKGVRFDAAFATAPITLPSHASLLTGVYPPGHGSRHNGMAVHENVPTLATILANAGFTTGAFVSAFPLDRRFGIDRGFSTYDDRLPRGNRGQALNERPGRIVVDEAQRWIEASRERRMFLWVHLFEPHAPYGDPRSGRSASDRYDDDVAEADVQVGRLMEALGSEASRSLVVVASDHGEAFGEHGEVTHSLFVYDTTLRVPLLISAPGIPSKVITQPVSLVDVLPTVVALLGMKPANVDGTDLSPAFGGAALQDRELYAESYAPLLDFGWSPLRTMRSGGFKFIEAPAAELYDLSKDLGETSNVLAQHGPKAAALRDRVQRFPPPVFEQASVDKDSLGRLQSLGYLARGGGSPASGPRPDPKDRRVLAAKMATVASGELHGAALKSALDDILREDPRNPQANLRLGYVLIESGECPAAIPYLKAAIAGHVPGVEAHLGIATCAAIARQFREAQATLEQAKQIEPEDPVVLANLGIILSDLGRHRDGVPPLQRSLEIDPDFHEARFNLARVFARDGDRTSAAREAKELLKRLPQHAPQRAEVERLLRAVE
jgi:choline-sulfatase